jgi:hypothetical protein
MSIIESSYLARVDVITARMKELGLSLTKLADTAPTTMKTLKRILEQGRKAHLDTYRKLANARALDVKDVSTLYIDPNSSQQTDVAEIGNSTDIVLDEDRDEFDETLAEEIAAAIAKVVGAKMPFRLIAIILNSVTLRIEIASDDLAGVLLAFVRADLDQFKVIGIKFRLPSSLLKMRFQLRVDRYAKVYGKLRIEPSEPETLVIARVLPTSPSD